MPWELIIGRGIAYCLHPQKAWRVLTKSGRLMVVCAYAGAAFTATMAVLLLK
jgi:hypothetical protein